MPNWCCNDIVFTGAASAIEDLHKKLCQAIALGNDPVLKANVSFEPSKWLGNIAMIFGGRVDNLAYDKTSMKVRELADDEKASFPDIHARGEIVYEPEMRDGGLFFSCDSAWAPPDDLLDFISEYYQSEIDYVIMATEPGCEIYINTDLEGTFFPERYLVRYAADDYCDDTYYENSQELLDDIYDAFQQRFDTIDDALAWANEQNEPPFEIYEYETEL